MGNLVRSAYCVERHPHYALRTTRYVLLFIALLLSACRSSNLPELSPEQIVQQSAVRMNELAGFRFDISRDGAAAYLDPDKVLSFRRATGAYVAPDKAIATVRIIGPGVITDVDVVTIAETQWQTNVATGEWEELPPNWGFNPAVLFDDEVGLQAILTADLTNLQLNEPQNLKESGGPDQLLYHLTGDATGERLYEMSGGLIGPQPVTVQLWIAPETFELVRVVVNEPEPDAGEASIWQVDFMNFGEVIEIEPPLNE
jgi:hypothetical protein